MGEREREFDRERANEIEREKTVKRQELSPAARRGQRERLAAAIRKDYAVKPGEWWPKTIPRALPLLLTGL